MDDYMIGVLLGLLLTAMVGLAMRLEKCHRSIGQMAESLHISLKGDIQTATMETSDNFVNDIKEELLDVVNQTIHNMRPPNIADHLGGILQQFAQMKMMKMMKKEGMFPDPSMLQGVMNNNLDEEEGAWHDDAMAEEK